MSTNYLSLIDRFVTLAPCLSQDARKKVDIQLAAQDFGKLMRLVTGLGGLEPVQADAQAVAERVVERIGILMDGLENNYLRALVARDAVAETFLGRRFGASQLPRPQRRVLLPDASREDLMLDVEGGFLNGLVESGRLALADDVVLVDEVARLTDTERVELIGGLLSGQTTDLTLLRGAVLPPGEPLPVDGLGGFDKIRTFMWIKTLVIFVAMLLFNGKTGAGRFDPDAIFALFVKAGELANRLCERLLPGGSGPLASTRQGKCRKDVYLESITATEVPDENRWRFSVSMIGANNDYALPGTDGSVNFVAGATGGALIPLGERQKMFTLPDGNCASRSTTAVLIRAQEVDDLDDNIASGQLLWTNEPPCEEDGAGKSKILELDVYEDGDRSKARIARIRFRVTIARTCERTAEGE